MALKQVTKISVSDTHNDVETFIPIGIAEGAKPGPTLAVLAGVHATEYESQDGAARFWESLDPETLSGKVLIVLAADLMNACAHSMYTNAIDGKNLNRVYPGKADGTLTEVIAHTLWEEVITKADAVIDCHGGEFDEYMAPYLITRIKGDPELDKKTLDLALSLGVPFIEVNDAQGQPDDPALSWLGRGTLSGETVLSGRPAVTIEAGGRGGRDPEAIAVHYNALRNALKHLHMVDGEPVPWTGQPVWLERGVILKATVSTPGVFDPVVRVGDWIDKDAVFARVLDFDGTLLEEIRTPESGTVLTVIATRLIQAAERGSEYDFAGKVGVVRSNGDKWYREITSA